MGRSCPLVKLHHDRRNIKVLNKIMPFIQKIWKKYVDWQRKTPQPNTALKFMLDILENKLTLQSFDNNELELFTRETWQDKSLNPWYNAIDAIKAAKFYAHHPRKSLGIFGHPQACFLLYAHKMYIMVDYKL